MGLINHVWLSILGRDDFREAVGLRYVSHMWDDDPYWLLWFQERPGVYRLELKGAAPLDSYDWGSVFVIKYYPAKTEQAFQGLSTVERLLRESEIFDTVPPDGAAGCPCHGHSRDDTGERFKDLLDGCGVPQMQSREEIPEDCFFAGHLSLVHQEDAGTVITAKSQTCWRVRMVEDYSVPGCGDFSDILLKKGSVDRDYPGQDITEFLFRRFTKVWKQFYDAPVARESRWVGDGVVFSSDGRNLTGKVSPDVRRIVLQTILTFRPGLNLVPPADDDMRGMFVEFSKTDFSTKEV